MSLFSLSGLGDRRIVTLTRMVKSHSEALASVQDARPVRRADLGCGDLQLLITSNVGLRSSPEVHSLILYGVIRPTILLPADIVDWTTPAERRAMIEHELAHVERRDTELI